jgi:hypothetical protein
VTSTKPPHVLIAGGGLSGPALAHGLIGTIGTCEQEIRDYVYPFMHMAAEHDQYFGGGALGRLGQPDDATIGRPHA